MSYKEKKQKFDGLAKKYDLYRLRYPKILFKEIKHWTTKKKNINILDIGSGTGIALEGIIKNIKKTNNFYASELSKDMICIGKKKFPKITWIKGNIEDKILSLPNMDIIIFAQSIHWINHINIFKKIKKKINKNGIICILQNNRNFKKNLFLNEYENILEQINKKYNRNYRKTNYLNEIKNIFNNKKYIFIYINILWNKYLYKKQFIGMINSSTQVKSTKLINRKLFNKKISNLINKYSFKNLLKLNYESELFIIKCKN